MLGWLKSLDFPSLLLGAFLGALASTWLGYFVKRPKLAVTGGGGGGGAVGFSRNHISIRNPPGILGIRFRETTILGWRLHGPVEWGLVLQRDPAQECGATLRDKETNEPIRMLWWRSDNGQFVQTVTINSGQQWQLYLFARKNDELSKYFVFEPDPNTPNQPKEPSPNEKFDDTRHFVVEISHSYGKKKFRIETSMTKKFDGRLRFQTKGGGGGSF